MILRVMRKIRWKGV